MESKLVEQFVVDDTIIQELIDYIESPAFTLRISEFKRKHNAEFRAAAESKHPEHDQPLGFYRIFLDYQELLDQELTTFSVKRGYSPVEIFRKCKDIIDGQFCPLFIEHEYKWFVDFLLAFLNYEEFLDSMMAGSRKSNHLK